MAGETRPRLVHSADRPNVEALVAQVAQGDSTAFELLYDEMSSQVYGVARRVVRDPERAEDVTQEVFLDVWRKASRFDAGLGSGRTWICTIAHRRAVDAVRRAESQKRYDAHTASDELMIEEPGEQVMVQEERRAVRRCLDTLTELQLESVRLAYFEGHTYNEVARRLGKPLPTIKTRMRDGLIRLRDCLEAAR